MCAMTSKIRRPPDLQGLVAALTRWRERGADRLDSTCALRTRALINTRRLSTTTDGLCPETELEAT